MNLTDYPTPGNDSFTAFCNGLDDATHLVALDLFSRDLERRLAACREVLDGIQLACFRIGRGDVGDISFAVSTMRQKANATLDLTAPLAELKP